MPRLTLGVVGIVTACGLGVLAAAQGPTFRSGVDAVQLDVTVFDKNHHVVGGLRSDDFVVFEDEAAVPVVGFSSIDLGPSEPLATGWMRDVAPDVVSNPGTVDRLIVLVLDDANTGTNLQRYSGPGGNYWDPWILKTGIKVARDIVNDLGPRDQAAVVFTFMGRQQNFTSDRRKLLAAIDSFRPKASPSMGVPMGCSFRGRMGCLFETLRAAAEALPRTPPRRKAIVLISQRGDSVPAWVDATSALRDLHQVLQQSNTTLYAFSPSGLSVGRDSGSESLKELVEPTGGRVIADTNAPWEHVRAVVDETSVYYLVAFQPTRRDGRLHKIRVAVRGRSDLEVRTRASYVAPKSDPPAGTVRKGEAESPDQMLEAALESGFPQNDVALAVQAVPMYVPGDHEARVTVVTGVRMPASEGESPPPIQVVTMAFDSDWKARAAVKARAISTRASGVGDLIAQVRTDLRLRPGRYELRIAAESAGRAGSLFMDLEVPDFANAPISASGIVLSEGTSDDDLSSAIIERVFSRSRKARTLVQIYRGGKNLVLPVAVETTIIDARNAVVAAERVTLAPHDFSAQRVAAYRFDLPLARLSTGEYLLTIRATLESRTVERELRFTVR